MKSVYKQVLEDASNGGMNHIYKNITDYSWNISRYLLVQPSIMNFRQGMDEIMDKIIWNHSVEK